MKKIKFFQLMLCILIIGYTSSLRAQNCDQKCLTSFINLNSGYNDQSGSTLNIGDPDPKWELIQVPLNDNLGLALPRPAFVIPNNWATNNNLSQWISGRPTAAYGLNNCRTNLNNACSCPQDPNACNQGPFRFRYQFCVCEDNSTINISLNNIMADNNCIIRLTGFDATNGSNITPINLFDHLNLGAPPTVILIQQIIGMELRKTHFRRLL